jgi:hypothetical protein
MSSQPYNIAFISGSDHVVMKSSIHLQNLAGTQFDIDVEHSADRGFCLYAGVPGDLQTESLVTIEATAYQRNRPFVLLDTRPASQ